MAKIKLPPPDKSEQKLKELIIYIAETCKNDPGFGATKLDKILFYADFLAYSILGKSITETKYYHLSKGPAPKRLKRIQEELIEEGRAKIKEKPYHGLIQKRLIPQKEKADISIFTKNELEIVRGAIDLLAGKNATEVSRETHNLLPWLLTEDNEEIPCFTVFTMYSVPVCQSAITWANNEIEKLSENGDTLQANY